MANTSERKHGVRRVVAAILVVLAVVMVPVATVAIWANRNFLDTERFVDRTDSVVEDPQVQELITTRVTSNVMALIDPQAFFEQALPERGRLLAIPLTNALRGFVRDRVQRFVGSDTFERLWTAALTVAHRTAVEVLRNEGGSRLARDGTVELNLIPVVDAVLARIANASPEILGRQVDLPQVSVGELPTVAIDRLERALGVQLDRGFGQVTVYDKRKLDAAREAVALFDRLVVILPILGVLLAAGALWVSPRRRRTLLQLSIGLMVGMILLRRVVFAVDQQAASLPRRADGRRAAAVVVDQFVTPLTTFALLAAILMGLVAIGAVLSGPSRLAVSFRTKVAAIWSAAATKGGGAVSGGTEPLVVWVRRRRDGLLVAGAIVGFGLLWALELSWFGLLAVVGAIGIFEIAVAKIGASPRITRPG